MVNLHQAQYTSLSALQRLVFNLLRKDELTSETMDRLYLLGSEKGFCQDEMKEIILDCQVEFVME